MCSSDLKVEGDIRGHKVKIGNDAVIKGTVFAESVELSGTLEGNIDAKNVFLTKTARMSGNVLHRTLQVEHGAFFNGNSQPHRTKNG